MGVRQMLRVFPAAVWAMLAGIALGAFGIQSVVHDQVPFMNVTWMALLKLAGTVGLVAFVYSLGASFRFSELESEARSAGFWYIVVGSLVVPALAGVAFGLLTSSAHTDDPFTPIIVNAVVFPTTAVPVLGAIMRELGILKSYRQAICVAILGDMLLWPMIGLAVTGSVVMALKALGGLVIVVALAAALHRLLETGGGAIAASREQSAMACVILALVGAGATEAIGMHMVAGAFIAGAITPQAIVTGVGEGRVERIGNILILPFFILPGLSLGLDTALADVLSLGFAYTLAAGGAKIAGVLVLALLAGYALERALTLAFLLNTRGTVELVVATAFLNAGLLSKVEFGAIVFMTIVCTVLTAPAVLLVWRWYPRKDASAALTGA
jgi:Kef-type K+ transport system membrane component KefB